MEIQGTVVQILPQVKGTSARGEWVKQEVILEQSGEFGRKVCVSFWGDKALDAAALKEGENISVSVNLESREFNNRWYTEIRVWKMVRGGTPASAPNASPGFNPQAGNTMPPMPDTEPESDTEKTYDDLPF